MILSACSMNQQETRIEKEYIVITIPEALLTDYCEFQDAGDTIGTLAESYVYNTNCGKKYKEQLVEQREWSGNVRAK